MQTSYQRRSSTMPPLYFVKGCRFSPTDEEIISHYLPGRIFGRLSPIEQMLMMDCDLYNEEPMETWERVGGGAEVFLFTKLKRSSAAAKKKASGSRARGSKIERKIRGEDGGTWHGEDAGSVILAEKMIDGRLVQFRGKKKRFNYKKEGDEQHGLWIMQEYSLDNVDSDWVVCRLKRNDRKRKIDHVGMEDPAGKLGKKKNRLRNQNLVGCPDPDSSPSMMISDSIEKQLTHNDDDIHSPPSGEECSPPPSSLPAFSVSAIEGCLRSSLSESSADVASADLAWYVSELEGCLNPDDQYQPLSTLEFEPSASATAMSNDYSLFSKLEGLKELLEV